MRPITKPLAFLDIESACPKPNPDPACDKIVTLFVRVLHVEGEDEIKRWFFNPGFNMSAQNIECHGITNEVAAGYPKLTADHSRQIEAVIKGCDLGGFNLIQYDVPLLWEELFRVGVDLNLDSARIVDVGNIFKLKEERSLSAAVRFYCGREHVGAHDAQNDVDETIAVFRAQLERYKDFDAMDIQGIADFSHYDERLDLAGKIIKGPNGVPVYNFGKCKGVPVVEDQGFATWMLGKDFSQNTKRVLRKVLGWEMPESQNEMHW